MIKILTNLQNMYYVIWTNMHIENKLQHLIRQKMHLDFRFDHFLILFKTLQTPCLLLIPSINLAGNTYILLLQ